MTPARINCVRVFFMRVLAEGNLSRLNLGPAGQAGGDRPEGRPSCFVFIPPQEKP